MVGGQRGAVHCQPPFASIPLPAASHRRFLKTNHQNQSVPNAPQTAAPAKFARGPMLQSHAPRNEPVVTTQ